ncbi:glycosyltransferase family 2 protein [Nocardioides humilatus]|uniref:Glycosyltransferase family 2 protein n=1 Tax=Nocardioides humilatus TaxID=2607660 RepID=A0A5B1L627_9ACTN|nr:glycosyltransferase family 2 protein [Nocardioides humilatus]KAA1415974.1 glycosyltransferase family 2 protein [Nocardioides humilatus]
MEGFRRTVGLVVLGAAVAGAGAVGWLGLRASVVLAIGCTLACLGIVLEAEIRVAEGVRRRGRSDQAPLAPRLVMAETRGDYAGPVTITALIPAHNEESRIRATLAALKAQTHPPDRIIVVADSCTDYTVSIAHAWGVEVRKTEGNEHQKAGALNQALELLLPELGDNDAVLVMDADTVLDPGFVQAAVRRLSDDRALMAIGGQFFGETGGGWLGLCQRNEYLRLSRDARRRRGGVVVLSGTASVFRPRALRTIAAHRGSLLPGKKGDVFDTVTLTEDDELTLALRSLGALMISPPQCAVVTDVMPTWASLWVERLRCQRGALENLTAYGVRPHTYRLWARQLGIGYGVVAMASFALLMGTVAMSTESWTWFPLWIGLALAVATERVITVWSGGWASRGVAALVLPELAYASFLGAVYVKGALDIAGQRKPKWRGALPDSGGLGALR